ncbi:NADH peroxidase [Aedoeadaptatus ivorii]|uniref:NADH peroxidase n=1 Tax=Aedoeadaptatus ivorii TaxID=54006 RepID=A0A448V3D2_9FIRM|nr:rubrerythrin family protein [Peptoniphilus ivorii]MDQ0508339.1 rubrerythrin [Peptoniphilus ivorii]VEJ36314.1 NADH peroxidase [Peptoniphilus ivorii]
MTLKGSKTAVNLLTSFAGESQANMRYTMYAKQAEKDASIQIRNIFEETARNEREHAKRFYKFLTAEMTHEELNVDWNFPVTYADTAANLEAAIAGENDEATDMYPTFAKIAKEEGFDEVAEAFTEISEVEEKHRDRYKKLLDNVKNDRLFERDEVVLWKCNNCGYIHEGKTAPDVCPACVHPQKWFELFKETY